LQIQYCIWYQIQTKEDEESLSALIIEIAKKQKPNRKGPFMTAKFKRERRSHQAVLKLKEQKLFKIGTDGGFLSALGGLPVLSHIAETSKLVRMASSRIVDWRLPSHITFPLEELLLQRLLLACSGFPDAIDCTLFRDDPALKCALSKAPDANSLASQSTHSRLEKDLTSAHIELLEAVPLDYFFSKRKHQPHKLTIHVDGTAIRTYGSQEQSIYRGGHKYSQTQYFPLVASTDDGELLLAKLRPGSHSDAKSAPIVQDLLLKIRSHWPRTKLTVVMDTGFNCPKLLDFFENEKIQYVVGYPATSSVKLKIKGTINAVEKKFKELFGDPLYIGKKGSELWQIEHERIQSLDKEKRIDAIKLAKKRHARIIIGHEHDGVNWDGERTVIDRVDFTDKGLDVRCIVSNIKGTDAQALYENVYTRRARIELVIKQNKNDCRVPLSCQKFTSNQFRFILQGLAYILLNQLRQQLTKDQQSISAGQLRSSLILIPVKIAASDRRINWHLSSVHPYSSSVIQIARKLQARIS
jgi:Transposase DDE domain group 1